MSRHSPLKLTLVQVHGVHPSPNPHAARAERRVKLGLGVNQQTGRVQWCPGLTCCKLLLLLPVVMLPLTLVLLLLLRLDGMLQALQLSEQRVRDQRKAAVSVAGYLDDYESLLPDSESYSDLVNDEFLLPHAKRTQLELKTAQKAKRCLPYRYANGETLELEERSILMKDARTSFLPHGSAIGAMPSECFDNELSDAERNTVVDDDEGYDFDTSPKKSTPKRYPEKKLYMSRRRKAARERREAEQEQHAELAEISLQSFWNEQGTREDIRLTQSKTMQRYMNRHVDPCVDFYQFACGNWERLHPIPKDKAGFDTFEMLRESLDLVLRNLLEKNPQSPSSETRVRQNVFKLNEQEPETDQASELKAERLRRHIVHRRDLLNRVLVRYKRFTNGTKRKRLFEPVRERNREQDSPSPSALHIKDKDNDRDKDKYKDEGIPVQATSKEFLNPKHDAQVKAKNLYKSCVNSELLNRRGLEPLHSLIRQLGGWPVLDNDWRSTHFNWQQLAATLRRYNNDILIVQWVGADIKNSEENIIQFDQTGLGLPTREYFLQQSNAKYLTAYQRYMSEVMNMLGASKADATHTATELIAFETRLAAITAPAEQRLNVTKVSWSNNYHNYNR